MAKTRLTWVDMLRGMCMMAILWFHTESYYRGELLVPYEVYVGDALVTFFFISGYLFFGGKPFDARRKVRSVLRGLLRPYFIFTLLLVVPKALAHGELDELPVKLTEILTGEASWFVAALTVGELAFTAVLHLSRGSRVCVAVFGMVGLALAMTIGNTRWSWGNVHDYWGVNEAMLACFFLALGYLYHVYEDAFDFLRRPWVMVVLLAVLACIKLVVVSHDTVLMIKELRIDNIPLFVADAVVCVALLTAVAKRLPRIGFVAWTGEHSLVYYFICGGVPLLVGKGLVAVGLPCTGLLWLLLAFCVVHVVASGVVWAAYRWIM